MKRALLCVVCAVTSMAAGTEAKLSFRQPRRSGARREAFPGALRRCHGAKGEGSRGPALTRPKLPRAPDDAELLRVIDEGIRGTEMPGAGAMSEHEKRQTAAYVRSLGKVPMEPVPGDPAHGAEIYRGKGNCATAIRLTARAESPDRIFPASARRAARHISANRWSIRRLRSRRTICW